MELNFEWDEAKAKSNLKKHHVGFETASRIFMDPYALTKQDRFENGEYRWQTIGTVDGYMVLLVAHTIKDGENAETIRIISARRANTKEKRQYYEQNNSV